MEILAGAPMNSPIQGTAVAGDVNLAFGGARTDRLAANSPPPLNNEPSQQGLLFGLPDPLMNAPPGLPSQIDIFIGSGGSFGTNDLATVLAGANDFFNLFDTSVGGANDPTRPVFVLPDQTSITATGVIAAGNVAGPVQRLIGFGAQNILVANLPNLGATPRFIGLGQQQAGISLIPSARLGYIRSDVSAFSEIAPLLALQFEDRELAGSYWAASLRAISRFGAPEAPVFAFAEIGYEDFFGLDADPVTARLKDNTALPVSASAGEPGGRDVAVKLGVSGQLSRKAQVSAAYGLFLNDNEIHTGKVQLRFPLNGE